MDVSTADQLHIFARLVIAGGLGAFIGIEREVRGYPAGIRTIALVALGACLFTDASQLFSSNGDTVILDPSRVAAQIVTGIGFLGAGVILRESGTIRGITTAATIWAAAAIGMAVGLSLYWVAVPGTLFIVLLLEARPFTRRLDGLLRRVSADLFDPDENRVEPPEDGHK